MSELSNELITGTAPGRQTPTPAGTSSSWYKLLEIEDLVFTERRIRLYGSVMLVTWAIVLGGFFLQGGWIIGHDGKLGSLDFCWIWLTGKFAISSDPARIYDPSVLAGAHDIFYRPGECVFIQMFDYPPTLLFLTYPLGHMPVYGLGWRYTGAVSRSRLQAHTQRDCGPRRACTVACIHEYLARA